MTLAYVIELNDSGTMNGNPCGDASHSPEGQLPNVQELQSLHHYGADENGPFLSHGAGDDVVTEGDSFTGLKTDTAHWRSTSCGHVCDHVPIVKNYPIDTALHSISGLLLAMELARAAWSMSGQYK